MLTNGDHSDEDAPLALPPPMTAPPPSTITGLNNKVHDPKHRPPPIQTGVKPSDGGAPPPPPPPPPKNAPPRTSSSLRRSSSLADPSAASSSGVVAIVEPPGAVVVAAGVSSASSPVELASSQTSPPANSSTSDEVQRDGSGVQHPKHKTSERKPFAEDFTTINTAPEVAVEGGASIRRDTMVPSEVPPPQDVASTPPPRRQESPPAPRTGRTRLSKSDYELLYCKLTDQEMDEMYGEFIGYNNNADGDPQRRQQHHHSGTSSAALPPPQNDMSTQTGKTRREEAVGIVWRNAHPEILPLYYMFLTPLLVLLNAASYFIHWKPSFIIFNAQSNNLFYGEETPFSLQLMAGGVFYFLFTTYLVVLPCCYSALTSGSHEAGRKAIAATIAFFVAAFPPWIFEAILVAVPVSEPYAIPSSLFLPHDNNERLYEISSVGFSRPTTMTSYISMCNAIVLGLLVLGAPWFVYMTAMADLMQKKARKAADEYMRSITT